MSEPERLPLAGSAAPLVPLTLLRAADASAPVVLVVPALGAPAWAYLRFAKALAEAGCHAAVLELRGTGESPVRAARGVDWGYADLVDGELAAGLAALTSALPGCRRVLLGHSLGAQAALLCRARHGGVDGTVLVAAGAPYWRAYPWPMSWVTRGFGVVVAASVALCGYYPGHRLGFAGREGATLMREWSRFVARGALGVEGWPGLDAPALMRSGRGPVLGLTLAGDHYAPPSALGHLLGLAGVSAAPERVPYPGKPGHFGWLREPQPVATRVAAFARAVGPSQ